MPFVPLNTNISPKVEKILERSPNVRIGREERNDLGNNYFGVVCLQNYVVMSSNDVD
jgi:hypothetical protein